MTTTHPAAPGSPLPFDEQVAEEALEAISAIIAKHPEVECMSMSVCWKGELNDAKITHGVWVGRDGVVGTLPGIVGSMMQTLKMLDEQARRGMDFVQMLRKTAVGEAAALVRRHNETQTNGEGHQQTPQPG